MSSTLNTEKNISSCQQLKYHKNNGVYMLFFDPSPNLLRHEKKHALILDLLNSNSHGIKLLMMALKIITAS